MTEESIFHQALALPIDQRRAFLEQSCAERPELLAAVGRLLSAHEKPGHPLDNPPPHAGGEGGVAPRPSQLPTHFRGGPDNLLGALFAGKYKIREKLGEGGMGTIYVADQIEPVQRRVALKLIRADAASPSILARFEQERQALALMDHPNIAKVFDAGIASFTTPVPPPPSPPYTGGREGGSHTGERELGCSLNREKQGGTPPRWPIAGIPYFVMELIKGVPITKYCDSARLTPRERLELFIPICQAIQHAHQKGIIHRDLKPNNILIGLYDGKPIPKVIDFGVAKATGPKLTNQSIYTEVGSLIGTLEYMSPEQAELNNLDIDTRTDIYALGVILYELLTGMVPFSQKEFAQAGLVQMLMMIKEVEPPKPSTKLSGSGTLPSIAAVRRMEPRKLTRLIKGDLDWIILKSLEKDRNRRYETAAQLAQDIGRYLKSEPVLAGRPGAAYRLRRWVRRNRTGVAVALVIWLITAASAAFSTSQYLSAEQARRDEAERAREVERERDAKGLALKNEEQALQAKERALKSAETERDAKDLALVKSDGLRLAAESTLLRESNPGLAMLLGQEAVKRYPHHLTYDALFGAAAQCRELRAIPVADHQPVFLRLSPDKTRFLTAGEGVGSSWLAQGTVVVWDLAALRPLVKWVGPCPGFRDLQWSPDGRTIAALSNGNMTIEYDDGAQPKRSYFTNRVVYVFDAATGTDVAHLRRHDDQVIAARFSPDSRKIVTASLDGTAKVWDARSGRLLHTLAAGKQALHDAQFSPDGRDVLTVYSNMAASKSDAQASNALEDPGIIRRQGRGTGVESQTGGWRWSGQAMPNPIARLWDADTGNRKAELNKNYFSFSNLFSSEKVVDYYPTGAWFLPAAERVMIALRPAASVSGGLHALWPLPNGGQEAETLAPGYPLHSALSPDHKLMATLGLGHQPAVWDLKTRKPRREWPRPAGPRTIWDGAHMKFSPDGKKLLLSDTEHSIHIRNVETGETIAALRGHGLLSGAEFHPDGKSILSADRQSVRLWTTEPIVPVAPVISTLSFESRPLLGRGGLWNLSPFGATWHWTMRAGVRNVFFQFHPNGRDLLIGTDDGSVAIGDILTGKLRTAADAPLGGYVTCGAFDPAAQEITFSVDLATPQQLSNSPDTPTRASGILSWNWETGKVRRLLKDHSAGVRHFEISPEASRLLVVGNGSWVEFKKNRLWGTSSDHMGDVTVWDRHNGTRICRLSETATSEHRPAFSLDGKAILLHTNDERRFGWFDAASGQPLRKFEAQDYGVTVWHSVFLSADKRTIIARSLTAADGMLRNFNTLFFWDAATGRHLGKVQVGPVLNYRHLLAFSPDGKSIAVPGQRNIYLLDIASRSVVATLQGHENEITCMAFSPDGRFLLTGSQDKTAVLWDVATGKIVHVLKGHPDAVLGLAFSPTGTHMATQSTDHIIRIWPVDLLPLFQKRLQRNFFPNERQRYELPETQSTR